MNKRDKNNVDREGKGSGPSGLARSASFNEIDRAVIEMRTKLSRDNTRPLISAATEERANGDERGSLNLSAKLREVLRANKRDLTNCLRSRRERRDRSFR